MHLTTLLFDLDGTLIDSAADLGYALNRLRADLRLAPLSMATIISNIGDGARLLVQRSLPESLYGEACLRQFLDYYSEHLVEDTVVYPGILDCLTAWQNRPMAIVTNKPYALTMEILRRLDLLPFFPVVIGGDSTETKKPDPLPVVQALNQLGQPAETALMIGDHVNDLLAGQAAGTRTCFCSWGLGQHRNARRDYQVADPRELFALLTAELK
ncbi:MAG: HAD-IA family hydrolase [Deltaproteobacteria bacterium]|jgi:phosphoglycolate phosphatase|nr:HAD-IA family hydrolase [Deltaproteobacteria bacterium]